MRNKIILRNEIILEISTKILKNSVTSNYPSPSTFIMTKNPCYGEETRVKAWKHFLLEMSKADPRPAKHHQIFFHIPQEIHLFSGQYPLALESFKIFPKDTFMPPKVFVTDLV